MYAVLATLFGREERKNGERSGSGSSTRALQAHTDWTAHPRAAEPAVSIRVLVQILLMVVLGVVERRRIGDLCGDTTVAGLSQFVLECRACRLGGRSLRGRIAIDRRPILRAGVVTLPHPLRGIVVFQIGRAHV